MDTRDRRVHRDMVPAGLSDLPLPRDDTDENIPGGDAHQRAVMEAFGMLSDYADGFRRAGHTAWYVSSQVLVTMGIWGLVWRHRPDLFVVPGVAPGDRAAYAVPEDGPVPAFVLEVADARTWHNDVSIRPAWYDVLGVQEYVVFDPTGRYLGTPLRGWRNGSDGWGEWSAAPRRGGSARVWESAVLGLALRPEGGLLRFDEPRGGPLPTRAELHQQADDERRRRAALEEELRRPRRQL